VEFRVNDVVQPYNMKLGEGGEAFFVFETTNPIPEDMQTSPLTSPSASPQPKPMTDSQAKELRDPEPLDLAIDTREFDTAQQTDENGQSIRHSPSDNALRERPQLMLPIDLGRSVSDDVLPSARDGLSKSFDGRDWPHHNEASRSQQASVREHRSASPPPVSASEALHRAINLSKKLWGSNIPSHVTESGDLMLDMTGYKSSGSEEDILRAEVIARRILSEELEGDYDIGSLISADNKGNLWIYSSEEAKEAAIKQAALSTFRAEAMRSSDAISDPGYHSDDGQSDAETEKGVAHFRSDSDSAVGMASPPESPEQGNSGERSRAYAKTLRLSSEQLKAMNLKPGANKISFSVNRATCHAFIFHWKHDVPIVISDIDGTITK
jgi:phosphatidate phosphatase LPIN